MKYRLGLDMGATSIGWSVFDIDTASLKDTGVRIFDDGREDKSKASLCVKRRNARGARRLINRRHMKTSALLHILTNLGLFPEDKADKEALKKQNPYELRAKALTRQLTPYELGRVFLQLAKRKGFKSNRKDDREEGGKLKSGYRELQEAMQKENAKTYGEFLYNRWKKNPQQPIRLTKMFDENGKYISGLFPFREVYMNEFEAIWTKQKEFYPHILCDEKKEKIKDVMFFQRPLKEAEEGECLFEKGEKRIPKAHPLFQEFRIWQHLLNLEFVEENGNDYEPLSKEQAGHLAALLQNPTELAPNKQGMVVYSTIKKALGLDRKGIFNYERKSNIKDGFEKGMLVNTTQNAMNKFKNVAECWNKLSDEDKGELINILARPSAYIKFPKKMSIEKQDKQIMAYLCQRFAFSDQAAEDLLYEVTLEDDFGSLSEKAIRKILPFIKAGMQYSDACKEAGYHHSDKKYDHLENLPYYGKLLSNSCIGKKSNPACIEEEFGRINNATVHVALNQVRYLVNELIDKYGKPYDIAVEYARDLNASAQDRLKMTDTRDKNEQENQRIIKEMNDKIGERKYNDRDIQKYKIWKQLSFYDKSPLIRECPFTGRPISLADLLNGQKVQIEHLLPFSRSLDDSLDNKVLAYVEANRYKGNRTPFEAFGESKDGYNWSEIQQRAKRLSAEQQWRFSANAMEKFEERESPIARSINDTRYMTRLLQDYLQPIVRKDGKQRVQAVVGVLTSMIRKAWGLNQYKNKENDDEYRAFHNHHAIDAIIVSAVERGSLKEVATQLKRVSHSVIAEFKDEFYKFRDNTVSVDDKKDLKKRIKDFTINRQMAIINQYFKLPENMSITEVLDRVANINISHKPSLKNINNKNSTIGKLHEDSAYGLKRFVDDKSLTAEFKFSGKTIEKDVTDYIPMFYHKEDKQAYYDAYKTWFKLDRLSSTLIANTKEEKEIKKQFFEKEQKAIYQLREASSKAFKWFIGGGNFCAEIYQINPKNKIGGMTTNDQGEWKTEIVSNYNATIRCSRGEDIAYWRYKYPNAKRIMTLRRNDMLMATFTREQAFDDKFPKGIQDYVREKFNRQPDINQLDVLFRVKKMGGSSIYFTPHNIAKEKTDTKSWIASAGAMQKYQARKVHVSFTGRVLHAK